MATESPVRIAIHGGAGDIPARDSAVDRPYLEALDAITQAAWHCLADGGTALDAVVLAVSRLEDCELFNAARGAVLTGAGTAELDASLMDGHTHRAAAVGAVRRTRNPVQLCHRLLDNGRHVMLVDSGADDFARDCGLAQVEPDYFITAERRAQLERIRTTGGYALDHDESFGTVGAVARDADGHLAAATSTGGMTNQWPGRLGDSAVIGAGTWADDASCAVSTTGHGESFIRRAYARTVAARMQFAGADLTPALDAGLEELRGLGGTGGAIAIDRDGAIGLRFTTSAMYRGWAGADGVIHSAVR